MLTLDNVSISLGQELAGNGNLEAVLRRRRRRGRLIEPEVGPASLHLLQLRQGVDHPVRFGEQGEDQGVQTTRLA